MTLFALGINHKTAPVELREQVAFTPDSMLDALESLSKVAGIDECIIVSTCNRTELYVVASPSSVDFVLFWLAEFHCISANVVAKHTYQMLGDDALRQIMRVASGLDSLVLGEPQILGQIKQAYQVAKQNSTIGKGFERVFQHVFNVAKRVRTETEIGQNAVSVAFAAVQLAKQIFSKLEIRQVLLIGAGETIELVAEHLKENGVKSIAVANRTRERAKVLAAKLDGVALSLTQLPEHIGEYDIVISSTASQLPLVGKGMIGDALKKRKNQPMFLVDLAVPRDIESQVNEIDDAYLYTVDDLQLIVEANLASREESAELANGMIEEQIIAYNTWKESQQKGQLVKQYRDAANSQTQQLINKALAQVSDGQNAERVIQELGRKLSNALLHAPSKMLSDVSLYQHEGVRESLARHFNLQLPEKDDKK
jgi:glutamyl-tRNA reductase